MANDPGDKEGDRNVLKRVLEDPQADSRLAKQPRIRANANGQWINSSFSASSLKIPVTHTPLAATRSSQSAEKSKAWISPSFNLPSKSGSSRTILSTPSSIRSPLVQQMAQRTETPSRPLSSFARKTPQSDPAASNPVRSTPRRLAGPPVFSVASSPPIKVEDKPHRQLSSRSILLSESSSSRNTPRRSQNDGSFLSGMIPKLAGPSTPHIVDASRTSFSVDVKSEESDVFDEVDRGLDVSPEKGWHGTSKRFVRNGLAERASETISRLAKDQVLWQNSIAFSDVRPDLKLRVAEILSVLPGRILTRCRVFGDQGADNNSECIVLFGPGPKELRPGRVIGAWRPWGELGSGLIADPFVAAPAETAPAEEANDRTPTSGVTLPSTETEVSQRLDPALRDAITPSSEHITPPTSLSSTHALLITRFLVLD